jgi:hypothetical protein
MSIQKLSVLIPAYNEEKTITAILDRLLAVKLIHGITKEIVIVNDAGLFKRERRAFKSPPVLQNQTPPLYDPLP